MKLLTEKVYLPGHWASLLINGDASGLSDDEEAEVAGFLADNPHLGGCLDCSESSELLDVEGLLTECLEFTFSVSLTEMRCELEYLIFPAHKFYEPLPWQVSGLSYTASGYGSRIPTPHVVYLAGRRYRIYCRVHSNVGVCYINYMGRKVVVP